MSTMTPLVPVAIIHAGNDNIRRQSLFFIIFSVFTFIFAVKANDIIYIRTVDDLQKIRENLSGHYVFDSDGDLNIKDLWTPIGTEEDPFTGYIEGNFHGITIQNISSSINKSDVLFGLFGCNKGTIKHITVRCSGKFETEGEVENNSFVFGNVAAVNFGYITGCRSSFGTINVNENFNNANKKLEKFGTIFENFVDWL